MNRDKYRNGDFERRAQTIVQVIITLLVGWVGFSVVDLGKSVVALQVQGVTNAQSMADMKADVASVKVQASTAALAANTAATAATTAAALAATAATTAAALAAQSASTNQGRPPKP
jgi:hypothetical protein